MELLVLPELSWTDDAAWMRALDFKLQEVPELDISKFVKKPYERTVDHPNAQTADVFAAERSISTKRFRASTGFDQATATPILFNSRRRLLSRRNNRSNR
jgi:hypothetical protein